MCCRLLWDGGERYASRGGRLDHSRATASYWSAKKAFFTIYQYKCCDETLFQLQCASLCRDRS